MDKLTKLSEITGLPMPVELVESCGESACRDVCDDYIENNCINCPVQKCMSKLKEYQDTGFEPEEIVKNTKVQFDIGDEGFLQAINIVVQQRFGITTDELENIVSEFQKHKRTHSNQIKGE